MSIRNAQEIDSNIINILYDEWKFRLDHYWAVTSKTFVFILILFFIPYMKDAWGINNMSLPNWIFPSVGIFFSVANTTVDHLEMTKINKIKDSINDYINKSSINIANPYKKVVKHLNLHLVIGCVQIIIGFFVLISVI